MSENWLLFWMFVGCAVVFVLVLGAVCGFVWFYFWALGKLLVAVITAICSGAASVLHSIRT